MSACFPCYQDGTTTQRTFVHVPSSIEAEESEEIGVEHLLRDVKNLSVGSLSNRVSDQLSSLQGLHSRLEEIRDYLQAVVAGTLPVNHQIIYNLQDIFNLLPNLDAAEQAGEGADGSKRPFTVATNDQLLVMYLSSLIRSVIALHDLVSKISSPRIRLLAFSLTQRCIPSRYSTSRQELLRPTEVRRKRRNQQKRRRRRKQSRKLRIRSQGSRKQRSGSSRETKLYVYSCIITLLPG